MAIMKVIKDADGNIINIGEWDYKIQRVQMSTSTLDEETGEKITSLVWDSIGNGLFIPKTRQEITNPLPDGAYEDKADIISGLDGGLHEK